MFGGRRDESVTQGRVRDCRDELGIQGQLGMQGRSKDYRRNKDIVFLIILVKIIVENKKQYLSYRLHWIWDASSHVKSPKMYMFCIFSVK